MKSKHKSGSAGPDSDDSRDRLSRLFLWLDESLASFEQRRAAGGAKLSPAEQEKEARTMISLIRVYEKLVEIKERLDEKTQGFGEQSAGETGSKKYRGDEAERKRAEIADRIERLQKQQKRAAGKSS